MKRLAILAAAAALSLSGAAEARQTTPPPVAASKATPATRALAVRYFEAIHYDKLLDQMMGQMIPVMIDSMRKQTPSVTDEQSALISEIVLESTRDMTTKMKEPMIDAVAEVFTEQELRDLVAFYEAPSGQAVITKTPELTQRMMAQMPPIMAEMQVKMLEKLCARMTCLAQTSPKGKANKS